MPPAHRLPPITVSYEQVFHAYTAPPLPEEGAPPTIIVTPAEPVSAQDFQIHFVSRPPSHSTVIQPSSRLSKFLSRLPGSGPKPGATLGRAPIGNGLGNSTRSPECKRPIVVYNGYEPYSFFPTSEYGAIRLPEDEDEFDNEGVLVVNRKERRSATRKMRMILFLMLPMLLVLFHLVSAWMGFGVGIGFGAIEMEAHHEHDDIFHANLWEWSSTHAVAMGDPLVADTLTAGGVVLEMEVATTTLDIENAPTPVVPIENDTL